MNHTEIKVLQETYKSAKKAVEILEGLSEKVYDQGLAYDLHVWSGRYMEFARKAKRALKKDGVTPKENSHAEKFTSWIRLQAATAWNISTPYIVNMVIRHDAEQIMRLMKVTHSNKMVNSYANEIAEEFMNFEEKNIEKLKSYL